MKMATGLLASVAALAAVFVGNEALAGSCKYTLLTGDTGVQTFKASIPGKNIGGACQKARRACEEWREANGVTVFTCNQDGAAPLAGRVAARCWAWRPDPMTARNCSAAAANDADAARALARASFGIYVDALCSRMGSLGDDECATACEAGREAGQGDILGACAAAP